MPAGCASAREVRVAANAAQRLRGPGRRVGRRAGLVRESPIDMMAPRNILVPTDLHDHADRVLAYAAALAGPLGAKIHVVHAFAPPLLGAEVPVALSEDTLDELTARDRGRLDELATRCIAPALLGSVLLELGDPRSVIGAAAQHVGADLIVMGTHGRRGLSRLVLGSVAESVARAASCPVLLFREP